MYLPLAISTLKQYTVFGYVQYDEYFVFPLATEPQTEADWRATSASPSTYGTDDEVISFGGRKKTNSKTNVCAV
jgi:hypothetical protein